MGGAQGSGTQGPGEEITLAVVKDVEQSYPLPIHGHLDKAHINFCPCSF